MMGEDRQVLEELLTAQADRRPVALAVIIRDQGSVPRHAGTKMLIYDDGQTVGTIGGGEMESRVIQAAQEALADGRTRIVPYSLVDPQRGDPGVCGGNVDIYVEPYLATATLYILGCGHVGRALASLGHWLGYRVVVWDDRAELITPDLVPDADVRLSGPISEALAAQAVDAHTFLALVTRNVLLDRQILPPLLETPAPFIGVMGSRRRWEETRQLLVDDGVPPEQLARVTSPIGLELNAESPNEIAVSIMAQIIMFQREGTGQAMAISGERLASTTG
ncbi:MAG: XdhC/CoxI family protein [Chloroflexota bacterium]|jgi:xanthine dehydrogenase accessory factor